MNQDFSPNPGPCSSLLPAKVAEPYQEIVS